MGERFNPGKVRTFSIGHSVEARAKLLKVRSVTANVEQAPTPAHACS